jgi:hypothetical protein
MELRSNVEQEILVACLQVACRMSTASQRTTWESRSADEYHPAKLSHTDYTHSFSTPSPTMLRQCLHALQHAFAMAKYVFLPQSGVPGREFEDLLGKEAGESA